MRKVARAQINSPADNSISTTDFGWHCRKNMKLKHAGERGIDWLAWDVGGKHARRRKIIMPRRWWRTYKLWKGEKMDVESLQIAISDAINKCDNWLTHSWTKISWNNLIARYPEASTDDAPSLTPRDYNVRYPRIIRLVLELFFLRYCVLETLTHDVHTIHGITRSVRSSVRSSLYCVEL